MLFLFKNYYEIFQMCGEVQKMRLLIETVAVIVINHPFFCNGMLLYKSSKPSYSFQGTYSFQPENVLLLLLKNFSVEILTIKTLTTFPLFLVYCLIVSTLIRRVQNGGKG